MLYIFNKKISNSKNILYSLTILYGINKFQSKKICKNIGINPKITINKLKNYQVNRLSNYIKKNIKTELILKDIKKKYINNLLESKNIRGIRKRLGLPVNGQRTRSNAKTSKKFKIYIKQNKYDKKNKKI